MLMIIIIVIIRPSGVGPAIINSFINGIIVSKYF